MFAGCGRVRSTSIAIEVERRRNRLETKTLTLSNREASQILAALRNWQEETTAGAALEDYFEAYFEEAEALTSDEIDALCRRIAEAK